jgi:vacuolar-type H+-ATPase subunit I/STV1
MFIIIGIMLTGMLLGFLLRNKRLSWIHKIITLLIWVLLFLLLYVHVWLHNTQIHLQSHRRLYHQRTAYIGTRSTHYHTGGSDRQYTLRMGTLVPIIYKE